MVSDDLLLLGDRKARCKAFKTLIYNFRAMNTILVSLIDFLKSVIEVHSNILVRIVDNNLTSVAPSNQVLLFRDSSVFIFFLPMKLSKNKSFIGVPRMYRGKEGSKEYRLSRRDIITRDDWLLNLKQVAALV
jgi:hypothetical protein